MESWWQDLRSTLRTLRRSPGFALLTVVSTALGIGMATLAFGAGYAHLLRPLPFPQGERLFTVSMERAEELAMPSRVSFPEFLDFCAQSHGFAAAAVYRTAGLTLFLHGAAERALGVEVSGDFFRVLGIAPALGRALAPEDEGAQAPPVIVLGDALWRRRFGGDPGIVGREILVDERPARVIGVMPPGFAFPTRQEAWVPLAGLGPPAESSPGAARDRRDVRDRRMMARLRPGISADEARAEVEAIGERLAARHPASTAGWHGYLRPLRNNFFSPETRLNLRYLAGASAFILLIAGANLVHLLLVRRVARRQELAIRAAFGAGPWSAARRIFIESALLAGTGGALGAVFAAILLARLQEAMARAGSPYWICYDAGLPVFLFALAATAVFALLLGLPAALGERRPDLSPVLKETSRGGGGPRLRRLRAALVVTQVAVSVFLLTGAALTVRSLLALRGEAGGVRAGGLVTFWTLLPGERYAAGTARAARIEDVLTGLRALPGIAAATASDDLPHTFLGSEATLSIPGSLKASPVLANAVASGYFRTLGARLLRGRDLDAAESGPEGGAAVVNQALERSAWPGENAVGKVFQLSRGSSRTTFRVAGVVADIRHRLLSVPAVPAVYVPLAAGWQRRIGFVLRTADDPRRLFPAAERRIHAADPHLPVFEPETVEELRADILLSDRRRTEATLLCGAVALFLSLLGVYGMLSAAVVQQLRGIGVRLALGATRWHVMRQIVWRGLSLTLAGIVLGLAGAVAVGRFLAPFLYQVSPTDPLSFAGVAILVFDAAFIACYLPARRVLEIDPVEALRRE